MSQILLSFVALLVAFVIGVVLQRFYPVGQLLQQFGVRQWLPVERNVPENNPAFVPNDWDVPAIERGSLHLFVLIGQSNMSGRGQLDQPDTPQPHPQVYELNKNFRWKPAREPLGSATGEVDWIAADGGTGVGPGLAFARSLLEQNPSFKIGLIQCARGASSLVEWQRDFSQNSLYGACLRRVRAATTYGHVAAVLVSQGESDADISTSSSSQGVAAGQWAQNFAALVAALREDVNDPDLPILFAQLGNFTAGAKPRNWDLVRQQQQSVELPRVRMIQTDDLVLDEGAHFDTAGQVEIGRRFAEAYHSLQINER